MDQKPSQPELSPAGKQLASCIEMDDKEYIVAEIRKHPIGLGLIYLVGFFITAVLTTLTLLAGLYLRNDSLSSVGNPATIRAVLMLAGFIIIVLSLVATFITAYLYQRNVIILTNEKLTQMTYVSLFNRRITQLGIGDIEDVTVRQIGVLTHLFNYGTLDIETAGEKGNFSFTFAPQPYEASKQIIAVHEEYVHLYGN